MAAAAPTSPTSPTPTTPTASRSGRPPRRRRVKWIAGAIVLVLAVMAAVYYWHQASLFTSTDDAYVQGHQVEITPLVAGTVKTVHVADQQKVKEGDPLFDIDPANYEIALARAEAQLAL